MNRHYFWVILTLALPIFTPTARAGTCVSGPQSGVWGPGGNPYIAIGGVTVSEGDTLIIEPGTVVLIAPNASGLGSMFRVEGTLIARGGPGELQAIIFTALDIESVMTDPGDPSHCTGREKTEPGIWSGFLFLTPGAGSIMEWCQVRYAGRGGNPSLAVIGTGPEDRNLTISNCQVADGTASGILMNSGASPTILNTTVSGHAKQGIIELAPSCHPEVSGCAVIRNGGYAVEAFADNLRKYSRLLVQGNTPDAIRVTSEPVTVSGTWQDHGIPYHYDRGDQFSIPVREQSVLTLEPGVEIRMGRNRGFDVRGTLIANGDSCRFITFTALDTASSWGRISLIDSGPGTVLNYVEISHGKSLRLSNVPDQVVISNSRITRSADKGMEITGNSRPAIFNNLISAHQEQGVWISTSAGFTPLFRKNLITGNMQGMVLYSVSSTVDLGTAADPGHNTFSDNEDYALIHQGTDNVYAVGNFWVATDSAVIDRDYIYDDDESAGSGPVIFNPFSLMDMSEPPGSTPCAPSCESLSVVITRPAEGATWETSARYLTLGGTAADDRGVAAITWTNTATGLSGDARLASPRTQFDWSAPQILLAEGTNVLTVTAADQDQCLATDELVVTFTAQSGNCWLFDTFESLPLGSLDGKAGWRTVPGRTAAEIIANPFGAGQVIRLDPPAEEPIIMEKTVVPQSSNRHELSVLVLAEPGDTSMAKIEVQTSGNPAWDKKFQLYFGATMRLNYGPTRPEAIDFLPWAEPRRWYHVRVALDLETDLVDVFLDDALVLDDIAVGPGSVEDISLSGWNVPGLVLYDDLRGCRISPLAVTPSPIEADGVTLWQNYPNPFTMQTMIRFALPAASDVVLDVFDPLGRKAATLLQSRLPAGVHERSWDGRDGTGHMMPAGVYLYQLRAGRVLRTGRMVIWGQ